MFNNPGRRVPRCLEGRGQANRSVSMTYWSIKSQKVMSTQDCTHNSDRRSREVGRQGECQTDIHDRTNSRGNREQSCGVDIVQNHRGKSVLWRRERQTGRDSDSSGNTLIHRVVPFPPFRRCPRHSSSARCCRPNPNLIQLDRRAVALGRDC